MMVSKDLVLDSKARPFSLSFIIKMKEASFGSNNFKTLLYKITVVDVKMKQLNTICRRANRRTMWKKPGFSFASYSNYSIDSGESFDRESICA